MTTTEYINPGLIIRNASGRVGDPELNHGMSEGWYLARLRDFLDHVEYRTYFKKHEVDIEIDTEALQMLQPKGVFNIEEVYAFNGVYKPTSARKVYYKREFSNSTGGTAYTATRNASLSVPSEDPYAPSDSIPDTSFLSSDILWYRVRDGLIMLSPSLASYSNLHIIYSGVSGSIGDVPFIPRNFMPGATAWVVTQYHLWKLADPDEEYKRHQYLHKIAADELDKALRDIHRMVVLMSDKDRADLVEYLSRADS